MTYKEALNNLDSRLHKTENVDRYNTLALQPDEMIDGKYYQGRIEKAFEIGKHLETEEGDREFIIAQLTGIVKSINTWLDKQGWS